MPKQQCKSYNMQNNLKSISTQIAHTPPSPLTTALLLLILSILAPPSRAQASPSVTLMYNQQPITIYSNNTLNPLFSSPAPTFSCSNVYKFTYNQTQQQLSDNQPYQIIIQNMPGLFNIGVSPLVGDLKPSQNVSSCFKQCNITITNNCVSQRQFDAFYIKITNLPEIFYNVICDSQIIFSPYQSGTIILVIFSVLQIIICFKFQNCNSFSNYGHYVNKFSLGTYTLVNIVGQIFILVDLPDSALITGYVCMGISMFLGVCGVLICVSQFLFWTQVRAFRYKLSAKLWVRLMDVIGFFVGGGLVTAWYLLDKNWIISNIIYIAMYTSLVKIVKFGSLQTAAIVYFIGAICNVTFIILTQKLHQTYFNDLILYLFNNPFFIYCPCINYTPNESCSWFFIACMVYPCILLCYLNRFDQSRSSKIYFLVFVVCLVVCSGLWIVMSRFVPFGLPFDMINIPICMILLCVFANRRGQLTQLWKGEIFDAIHRNIPQQQKQLITSLKQDRSQSFKSDIFKIKFTNLSSSSASAAMKNVRQEFEMKGLDSMITQKQSQKCVSVNISSFAHQESGNNKNDKHSE